MHFSPTHNYQNKEWMRLHEKAVKEANFINKSQYATYSYYWRSWKILISFSPFFDEGQKLPGLQQQDEDKTNLSNIKNNVIKKNYINCMYEIVVYWQDCYHLKWSRAKLFELLFQLLLISFLVSCLVWSWLLCEHWQSLCCVYFLGGLWTTYRLPDLLSWSLISTHPLSTYTAHFHLLSARLLPFHCSCRVNQNLKVNLNLFAWLIIL